MGYTIYIKGIEVRVENPEEVIKLINLLKEADVKAEIAPSETVKEEKEPEKKHIVVISKAEDKIKKYLSQLSSNALKILRYIKNNPGITSLTLAEKLGFKSPRQLIVPLAEIQRSAKNFGLKPPLIRKRKVLKVKGKLKETGSYTLRPEFTDSI